jgi:hypothetical protein
MPESIKIEVVAGDALSQPCDVLVLKYAQNLYGVDLLVYELLGQEGRQVELPPPWGHRLEKGASKIAADRLLFIGVPTLREFGYPDIREFGSKALSSLAGKAPNTRHIALTLHGAGYGLDEVEAFEAEVAGLLDSIASSDIPEALSQITFIELNPGRAIRMGTLLQQLIPTGLVEPGRKFNSTAEPAKERLRVAGYESNEKAHVFVAMPFKDEMEDVYHYGIQSVVRAAGFICERADLSSFTGDVIDWVRSRIKSSSFVIADLTEANPNVYLEVGYAWGCEVPTLLIVKNPKYLKFDVQGQRCLTYKKIKDLEDILTKELAALGISSKTKHNLQ